MNMIDFKSKYGWLTAKFDRYSNGHLGIQLFKDGFPFAKMSTNLPDTELDTREFHFNTNDCFEILRDVLDCGHFENMNRPDNSGFCTYTVLKVKDHVELSI